MTNDDIRSLLERFCHAWEAEDVKTLVGCYAEDCVADVDLNLIMTGKGEYVEVQGTAERAPFSHEELQKFLELGWNGIKGLVEMQRELLGDLR